MENNMEHNITTEEDRHKELSRLLVASKSDLTEHEQDLLSFAVNLDHGIPYFKIKHFVGDAQVTPYAKYKQFLLEIRAREEVIENLLMNIAKQEAQIEVLQEDRLAEISVAKLKLKDFELITNKNDLVKIHRRLQSAYSERKNFLLAVQEMYATKEAYLPDGTDLRDAVNDSDLSEKLEAEHWRSRLGKQAALDILTSGKIGTGNMDAISMLSEDDAVQTLGIALSWSTRVGIAIERIQSDVVEQLKNTTFNLELTPAKLELE